MYYIDDHRKQAINKIIPYLIDFPSIVSTIEINTDRWQAIEDVLWKIADNFKISNSRGIFLTAHANNEVVDFIYTDKADDAFTYGTTQPLYQAYGTGHYYSQASYISGSRKTASEDKTIRSVQAKIIQNNTDCTIEDLIESLKLLYNATSVKVYESNPLRISILLEGNNLEISSSGNYENVKRMLAGSVSLTNIFVNPYTFNTFLYSTNTDYGTCRYPVRIGESVDVYSYRSHAVTLNSTNHEYIQTNHSKLDEDEFICVAGCFTQLNNNAVLISSSSTTDSFAVNVVLDSTDNKYYFCLNTDGVSYSTDVEAKNNTTYTLFLCNTNNNLKLWVLEGIYITGETSDKDYQYIKNKIQNTTANVEIISYTTIDGYLFINRVDGSTPNYANFTYYAIMFADFDEIQEYYVTHYGEKHILFNCLSNDNHLFISTDSTLQSNLTTTQGYYNYGYYHSGNRYLYLDGESGISYNVSNQNTECDITSFDISFDICCPVSLQNGTIVADFIGDMTQGEVSEIKITSTGSLILYFKTLTATTTGTQLSTHTYTTDVNVLQPNEYANIRFVLKDNKIYIYKNNEVLLSTEAQYGIYDIHNQIKIGYNDGLTAQLKGFIRNLLINIQGETTTGGEAGIDLFMPYTYSICETNEDLPYINAGARFLTVPQLIDNTTEVDIYNNNVIHKR